MVTNTMSSNLAVEVCKKVQYGFQALIPCYNAVY